MSNEDLSRLSPEEVYGPDMTDLLKIQFELEVSINDRVRLKSNEVGVLTHFGHHPNVIWFADETGGGFFVSTSDVQEIL